MENDGIRWMLQYGPWNNERVCIKQDEPGIRSYIKNFVYEHTPNMQIWINGVFKKSFVR